MTNWVIAVITGIFFESALGTILPFRACKRRFLHESHFSLGLLWCPMPSLLKSSVSSEFLSAGCNLTWFNSISLNSRVSLPCCFPVILKPSNCLHVGFMAGTA